MRTLLLLFSALTCSLTIHAKVSIQNDARIILSLKKQLTHEDESYGVVVQKIVNYYIQTQQEKPTTKLHLRLRKNAALLKSDPEIYCLHAIACYSLLKNREQFYSLSPIIAHLKEKVKQVDNTTLIFHCEDIIAIYYEYIKKYHSAINHYEKALQLSQKIRDTASTQIIQSHISYCYFAANNLNKAEEYVQKSLSFEKYGFNNPHVDNMLLLAKIFSKRKDRIDEAISIHREIESKVPARNKDEFYNTLGELYLKKKDYQNAEKNLLNAKQAAEQLSSLYLPIVYQNLSECYHGLHDFEKSYTYLALKDSVEESQMKEKYLSELGMEEKKIKNLVISKTRLKYQHEREKTFKLYAFLLFLLIVLITTIRMVVIMRNKNIALTKINLNSMGKTIPDRTKGNTPTRHKISGELILKIEHLINTKEIYRKPDLSIQKLAKMLNTNASDLSQTINGHYGVPFRNLLNNKRIDMAKHILLDDKFSHYSMEGIALTVGYANQASFYRHFKEITGLTPATFKSIANRISHDHENVNLVSQETFNSSKKAEFSPDY